MAFINSFPAGLSTKDLEVLASMELIPSNWVELLLTISRDQKMKLSSGLEAAKFLPDNYFIINVTNDASDESLQHVQSVESVQAFFQKSSPETKFQILITKL